MASRECQYTLDQILSSQVSELSQIDTAAKVGTIIGVTTWATQWTLPRDFDREDRKPSPQDVSPGLNHFDDSHNRTCTTKDAL